MSFLYLKTLYFVIQFQNSQTEGQPGFLVDTEKTKIEQQILECYSHQRKVVTINKKRTPATVQLIGCPGESYLGVKVSFFDDDSLQEKGVFLSVCQTHWLKEPN